MVWRRHMRLVTLICALGLLWGTRIIQDASVRVEASIRPATVAIVQSENTQPAPEEIESMVRQAVSMAGGLQGIIKPGDVVVIKPNLVLDVPPETGIVVHPIVAHTVVKLAQEAGAGKIYIAEGSSGYYDDGKVDWTRDRFVTKAAFVAAGYDSNGDMVDDATGIPLVDLNISGANLDDKDPNLVRQVTLPQGLIRKEYWFPNLVLDCDVLISVAVLKNHYIPGVTLGMKNMIGVLPSDIYHAPTDISGKGDLPHFGNGGLNMHQAIVDLNLVRKPDFLVVDGLIGLMDGPGGHNKADPPMRLIMASSDVVAGDSVGTLVMGYDPYSLQYLVLAQQQGLGTMDPAYIRVVGKPVEAVRHNFPVPWGEPPLERADQTPPQVQISGPSQAEMGGEPIIVSAKASDDQKVAKVELYVDDTYWDGDSEAPYSFTLDAEKLGEGSHTLKVVACDKAFNQDTATMQLQVLAPTPTPTKTPKPTSTPTPTKTPKTTKTPTPEPSPTHTPEPLPTATPETVAEAEAGQPPSLPIPLLVGGGLVMLGALAIGGWKLMKRGM